MVFIFQFVNVVFTSLKKKAERYLAELQSGLNEIKLINIASAR